MKYLGVGLFLLLLSVQIQAMPEYYDWWLESYSVTPDSGEASCQLCHESAGGGDGWNLYGWEVRDVFLDIKGGFNDDEIAFKVGLNDIRNTPSGNGNTFLQEIQAGAQPGWREGNINLIRYKNNSQKIISPPIDLCGLIDPASVPIPCEINDPIPSPIPQGDITINLETIATDFVAPILALSAPGESDSIYVVQQGGEIWRVDLASGAKELFLDFSNEVIALGNYDERGLLGVAFHPDYANNNKIYTYISKDFVEGVAHFSTMPDGEDANHLSVVSEWLVVNPQSSPAIASSENELLIVEQPQFNHNGGMIAFDPDGLLYISFGDGGNADDEGVGHGANGNGRDNTNPLGSIVRIDVDTNAPANGRYGIPPNNPFVGSSGLDEIYAYGFRNPFRFSFEALPSNKFNLYVGDVGQNSIEEIDRIHSDTIGGNYGWNYKEGSFFFYTDSTTFVSDIPPPGVVLPPLIDPVTEYDHDEGISVIGGHVYTGGEVSGLQNKYVFADWSSSFSSPSGRLFYLDNNDVMHEFRYMAHPNMFITGFGKDSQNELYVVGSESINPFSTTGILKKITSPSEELCFPIKVTNGNVAVICL